MAFLKSCILSGFSLFFNLVPELQKYRTARYKPETTEGVHNIPPICYIYHDFHVFSIFPFINTKIIDVEASFQEMKSVQFSSIGHSLLWFHRCGHVGAYIPLFLAIKLLGSSINCSVAYVLEYFRCFTVEENKWMFSTTLKFYIPDAICN